MKKALSIAIPFAMLLLPILGVGQGDTTTYWYSYAQDKHLSVKADAGVMSSDGKPYANKQSIAPNGLRYTCLCNVSTQTDTCCGHWDDLTMVCMTIDGEIQPIESRLGSAQTTYFPIHSIGGIGRINSMSIAPPAIKKYTIFSCCDETPRSADSIGALGFVFVDTCCSSIWQRWPDGRYSCCPTKKDTVLVDVACKRRVLETFTNHASSSALHVSMFDVLEVKTLRQERTLEWQEVSLPIKYRDGITYSIYAVEEKWVITKTNWIESVEGCFQLTQLTD